MNRKLVPLLMFTALLLGAAALADDAPTAQPNQTDRQLMQHCMAEQKTKSPGASAKEMKKTCQEQVKSYREHPSATSPDKAPHP
jgi:hypothetical protein